MHSRVKREAKLMTTTMMMNCCAASSPSQDSNRNEAVDTDSSGGSGRMVNGVQGGQQTTVDVGGRLQRGRASRAAFKISSTTDSCSAKCHSSQHLMQQQQNSNCCDSTTALVRTQQMPGDYHQPVV